MEGVGLGVVSLSSAIALGNELCQGSTRQSTGPFPPKSIVPEVNGRSNPGEVKAVVERDRDLTKVGSSEKRATGQILYVQGQVVDENCEPVPQAHIHLWQADNNGFYNHQGDDSFSTAAELDPHFQYAANLMSDEEGQFSFTTILPKYYKINEFKSRSSHFHFLLRKTGYSTLVTQSYFEGDVLKDIETIRALNKTDIILSRQGEIRPDLKDLIVEFQKERGMDMPVGSLRLVLEKLS